MTAEVKEVIREVGKLIVDAVNAQFEEWRKENRQLGKVDVNQGKVQYHVEKRFKTCWNCNSPGHLRRHCRLPGVEAWRAQRPRQGRWRQGGWQEKQTMDIGYERHGEDQRVRFSGRCWMCMQLGHKREFCPMINQHRNTPRESGSGSGSD